MTFQHPDLEQFYERVMATNVGGVPVEEHPVFALMDAYGWFRLIDRDQTAQINEIIGHLLSPDLRPALRSWYQRHKSIEANQQFNGIRKRLSELAGENF
jgi:hypothetical protein